MNKVLLQLHNLPFNIGVREVFSDPSIPSALSFKLGLDEKTGLTIQLSNPVVRKALIKAYQSGSMLSTPLGEGTFGQLRMQALLNPLLQISGNLQGKDFLEIGCGTGAPMAKLIEKGAIVTGVEVGPQAIEATKKTGAFVIQKPFSSDIFSSKFDCIYSLGVLEHIENIVGFLKDAAKCLKAGGLFYAALQNADPYLKCGDITLLMHEHWNYFTPKSAQLLLQKVGFTDVNYTIISEYGELCFWGFMPQKGYKDDNDLDLTEISSLRLQLETYCKKTTHAMNRMRKFFSDANSCGFSIALYGGGLQYLVCASEGQIFRFVDGDKFKHGKKYLNNTITIEPPSALLEQPVDYILVCARSHSDSIKLYLQNEINIPSSTQILTVDDVINNDKF